MNVFWSTVANALLAGTPLAITGLGELMEQRTGVMNIGLEGLMLIGAVVGFAVGVHTGDPNLGLLAGAVAGGVFVLIFSLPVVYLNTDQLLPGFAVWLIGIGLSDAFGYSYTNDALPNGLSSTRIPLLGSIPQAGQAIFDNPWPVYLALVLPFVAMFVLYRTRHGLNLRSIGSDPIAADAAGVPVRRLRFTYTIVTGLLAGFSGAFLSLAVIGRWEDSLTAGRGFVALAIVIFAQWRPLGVIPTSFLFGLLLVLAPLGQALGWPIQSTFLDMVPYVVTVLTLILWSVRQRRRPGAGSAPTALGSAFIRGA